MMQMRFAPPPVHVHKKKAKKSKKRRNRKTDYDDIDNTNIQRFKNDLCNYVKGNLPELTEGLNEVIKRFSESGHSRIPVYDEDIDDIVGMLYVKDLLELFVDESKREKFTIKKYMREPMFVYENLKCDDLFDEFQKTKVQVAIVLDEYGGTYGIVSMEDLLESIVGDIQDEFDDEDQEFEELNENHYIVDGAALIDDVSKLIDIELDDSENDTIGGLVMDKLGYVPEEDEHPSVQIGRAIFTIKNMDDKSIDKIDIVITPEKQEEEK